MMFLLKPMSNQNDFAWQGGLEASILPGKSQRSEALLARGCLFGRGKVEAVEEEEVDKEVDKEVDIYRIRSSASEGVFGRGKVKAAGCHAGALSAASSAAQQ